MPQHCTFAQPSVAKYQVLSRCPSGNSFIIPAFIVYPVSGNSVLQNSNQLNPELNTRKNQQKSLLDSIFEVTHTVTGLGYSPIQHRARSLADQVMAECREALARHQAAERQAQILVRAAEIASERRKQQS
jgi:hypothetical protein